MFQTVRTKRISPGAVTSGGDLYDPFGDCHRLTELLSTIEPFDYIS